jgi:CHASE2 domain-containing sensor protein
LFLLVFISGVAIQDLAKAYTNLFGDQLLSQHPSVAIVAITDDTLAGYRTYLPVDRGLLARVVEAVDAAGAKVIGLDFLFTSPTDGNEILLIEAIRRARAKVVLGAADERIGLTARQTASILSRGRSTGGLFEPIHRARFGRALHGRAVRRRQASLSQELRRPHRR